MIVTIILILIISLGLAQRTNNQQNLIKNIIDPHQEFLVKIWIQEDDKLVYEKDYYMLYTLQQPQLIENITLNVQNLTSNLTLYASMFKLYPQLFQIAHQQRNLTRYQRVRKMVDQQYSGSYDPIDEIAPRKTQENNESLSQYSLHIAKDFNVMFIHSDVGISQKQALPVNLNVKLFHQFYPKRYTTGIDLSQMHIPFRTYQKISDKSYNVVLHIFPYDLIRYASFYSIGHPQAMFKQMGPMMNQLMELGFDQNSFDQIKQILFTNHIYLVICYFVLSTTQMFLRFFTIKHEYYFWKNIQNNRGVSLKTLFYQLVFSSILTLYVYQYNSSKLIIFFQILNILLTVWKISRTFSLRFKSTFPYLRLETTELYKKRQKLDSEAIWYLNYALIPLSILYIGWSLYSKNFIVKNYYIFFLETSVAFIAIFGFIMMTPQLYINYKLKSVDHLNWKGLIYRFINTLLDDFFACMVTMPMMRRLMYFRDDVIFVCYIYQRWIYRVDYSRKAPECSGEDYPQSLKKD